MPNEQRKTAYNDILSACGLKIQELRGKALEVYTPVDGQKIATLDMHDVPATEAMIDLAEDGVVRQSLTCLKVPRSHKPMKRRFGTTP